MINRVRDKLHGNYTIIPNELFNGELTPKAFSVFCYLLSRPDNWKFNISEISTRFKAGKDTIRTALKELEEKNLLIRVQIKDAQGKFSYVEYILYPTEEDLAKYKPNKMYDPIKPQYNFVDESVSKNPTSEKPTSEKPTSENPTSVFLRKNADNIDNLSDIGKSDIGNSDPNNTEYNNNEYNNTEYNNINNIYNVRFSKKSNECNTQNQISNEDEIEFVNPKKKYSKEFEELWKYYNKNKHNPGSKKLAYERYKKSPFSKYPKEIKEKIIQLYRADSEDIRFMKHFSTFLSQAIYETYAPVPVIIEDSRGVEWKGYLFEDTNEFYFTKNNKEWEVVNLTGKIDTLKQEGRIKWL